MAQRFRGHSMMIRGGDHDNNWMKKQGDDQSEVRGEEKAIALAIRRDKGSLLALKWAIENHIISPGYTVILLHVVKNHDRPSSPNDGNTLARPMEDLGPDMNELFLPFRCCCARKMVKTKVVVLKYPHIAKAIIDFVSSYPIEILIMASSSKNIDIGRLFKMKRSSIVMRTAPRFCTVYLISRGKLTSKRPATHPLIRSISNPTSRQMVAAPVKTQLLDHEEAESEYATAYNQSPNKHLQYEEELSMFEDCTSSDSSDDDESSAFDDKMSDEDDVEVDTKLPTKKAAEVVPTTTTTTTTTRGDHDIYTEAGASTSILEEEIITDIGHQETLLLSSERTRQPRIPEESTTSILEQPRTIEKMLNERAQPIPEEPSILALKLPNGRTSRIINNGNNVHQRPNEIKIKNVDTENHQELETNRLMLMEALRDIKLSLKYQLFLNALLVILLFFQLTSKL